jgi:hypothetical protein
MGGLTGVELRSVCDGGVEGGIRGLRVRPLFAVEDWLFAAPLSSVVDQPHHVFAMPVAWRSRVRLLSVIEGLIRGRIVQQKR